MKRLLIKALTNVFDMQKEDAHELAKTVEKTFRGKEEVEDMTVDKYVRSMFYELQREQLLKLRREEIKENGKQTRKFYWSFDNKGIKDGACRKIEEEPYKIYEKIPRKAWLSHAYNNS
ncbi:MAG: hypothetical protein NT038_02760 [Euryarchaeota archaeon]|nr:hypothetical protein [Euryarchaeota archaeon]